MPAPLPERLHRSTDTLPALRWAPDEPWWPGLAAVLTAALADAVSTIVGIYGVAAIVEKNGLLAAQLFAAIGTVPGVLILTAITVAVPVASTELGREYLRASGHPLTASAVLVFGYGVVTVTWTFVAARNLALIASFVVA